jgi:ribose 1,5-bisphosphokinase
MSGAWIFVCGPSGVGKDSVLGGARQALAHHSNIVFARRVITRAQHAGSDHDAVNAPAFLALLHNDHLRWHWQAHGFHYGVGMPYAEDVRAGRLVVVNGSRAHAQSLVPSADVRVVHITASPERLAARLVQRARDTPEAIATRLLRNAQITGLRADCTIANDADLNTASQALVDYLLSQASVVPARATSKVGP